MTFDATRVSATILPGRSATLQAVQVPADTLRRVNVGGFGSGEVFAQDDLDADAFLRADLGQAVAARPQDALGAAG